MGKVAPNQNAAPKPGRLGVALLLQTRVALGAQHRPAGLSQETSALKPSPAPRAGAYRAGRVAGAQRRGPGGLGKERGPALPSVQKWHFLSPCFLEAIEFRGFFTK